MRLFLTGVTGYIGGSIAARLVADGYEVAGLTRDEAKAEAVRALGVEPVLGSLDDTEVLAREAARADSVINAADSDHQGAVEALLDALVGTGKVFLHTSGSSIVGDDARGEVSEHVYTEDDIDNGWQPTPDKAARVTIDRLVRDAAGRGVRSAVLCNSLIYGEGRGMAKDSVQIPRLVRQARSSGIARHVGPGRNIWSTVHIDDVVDLYLLALADAEAGSFFFVESGESSFAEITQAIAEVLGLGDPQSWDIESAIGEWGYEPAIYALGSNSRVRGERARARLGWTPKRHSAPSSVREDLLAAPGNR